MGPLTCAQQPSGATSLAPFTQGMDSHCGSPLPLFSYFSPFCCLPCGMISGSRSQILPMHESGQRKRGVTC